MPFVTNELVEIETPQFRVLARVRNVQGDRLHVALERGGYLPWINDPVLVRHADDESSCGVDARIVHASGATALIELARVPPAVESGERLPTPQES